MWEDAGHPVRGTAAMAGFWVALEQPGPWGSDAFTSSWMGPQAGAALQRACQVAGGRCVLIRSVSDHRRHDDGAPRTLYVAGDLGGASGGPWLITGVVADPADLLDVDLAALAHGGPEGLLTAFPTLRRTDAGILLVCTNGKRDVCCAVRGRPVALEAARRRPGQVWECTHTGGHRFAATGIGLPSGHTIARLTPDLAVDVVDAEAGRRLSQTACGPDHDRGRSHLAQPCQAAEGWVREQTGETALAAITSRVESGEAPGAVVVVEHVDGRRWRLRVHKEDTGHDLVDSCGTPARPGMSYQVDEVPA